MISLVSGTKFQMIIVTERLVRSKPGTFGFTGNPIFHSWSKYGCSVYASYYKGIPHDEQDI